MVEVLETGVVSGKAGTAVTDKLTGGTADVLVVDATTCGIIGVTWVRTNPDRTAPHTKNAPITVEYITILKSNIERMRRTILRTALNDSLKDLINIEIKFSRSYYTELFSLPKLCDLFLVDTCVATETNSEKAFSC